MPQVTIEKRQAKRARRLNKETEWMSRRQIQDVTYESITRLVTIKGEMGVLSEALCKVVLRTIDDALFSLNSNWISSLFARKSFAELPTRIVRTFKVVKARCP